MLFRSFAYKARCRHGPENGMVHGFRMSFDDVEARPFSTPHIAACLPEAERTPIYLFGVPTMVFEPYEAIGSLAVALLRDRSCVSRIRYIVEGDIAGRRADLVRAVFSRAPSGKSARQLSRTDTPLVPVVLRGRLDPAAGPREREAATTPLFVAVTRSFAWAGLVPAGARGELEILRYTTTFDDDERSVRGELSILATRTSDASYLIFFDDGSRELLLVTVPQCCEA